MLTQKTLPKSSLNVFLVIALCFILYAFSPLLFISSYFCHLGMENNLINSYDEITCLLDEGTAVNIAYLDFSKVSTLSHKRPS